MYDKGAMDTNHDFIDGVLKANRSKCSGSAGYLVDHLVGGVPYYDTQA